MALIDRYLPEPAFREVDHIAVAADAERAWAAVRGFDFYQINFVRWLFAMRMVPERFNAWLHGQPSPLRPTSTIDDIARQSDFQVLEERDGEVVVGAIGRFWQPVIDFVRVQPHQFASFAEPELGKVAWSLLVSPRLGGGSFITIDLRVAATDENALAHFRLYWKLIGPFSRAIRGAFLRHYQERLGASPDEIASLPGDELLSDVRAQKTHAVDIEAAPSRVWPWLVQMGCRRGGWYSYDRLDNGGTPSADHIIASLQEIAVGDLLPATPEDKSGFAVRRVDPERVLVLGSLPEWNLPYQMTWSFVLEPIGSDATHLMVRVRGAWHGGARMKLYRPLILAVHDVMERKQLATLKLRAEAN